LVLFIICDVNGLAFVACSPPFLLLLFLPFFAYTSVVMLPNLGHLKERIFSKVLKSALLRRFSNTAFHGM